MFDFVYTGSLYVLSEPSFPGEAGKKHMRQRRILISKTAAMLQVCQLSSRLRSHYDSNGHVNEYVCYAKILWCYNLKIIHLLLKCLVIFTVIISKLIFCCIKRLTLTLIVYL